MAAPRLLGEFPALLLAHAFHHSEDAWAGVLCGLPFVGSADHAVDREPRSAPGRSFPEPGRKVSRFSAECLSSTAEHLSTPALRVIQPDERRHHYLPLARCRSSCSKADAMRSISFLLRPWREASSRHVDTAFPTSAAMALALRASRSK